MQLLGVAAVAVAVLLGIGAPLSLVVADGALLGASWRLAALASIGLAGGLLAVFFLIGRPWRQALSTRYW